MCVCVCVCVILFRVFFFTLFLLRIFFLFTFPTILLFDSIWASQPETTIDFNWEGLRADHLLYFDSK